MKIRYHLDRKTDGLVILESEPQVRTMFIYSQNKNTLRVPLPYIIFVVRYLKDKKGFKYPGIYGSGLFVYGKFTPLKEVSDGVVYLPTDKERNGMVCTDHNADNKIYKTVNELVNEVVTLWFSHTHNLEYDPFLNGWSNASLENISKGTWLTVRNFQNFYSTNQFAYGQLSDRNIPIDAQLIDATWPIDLEISPLPQIKEAVPLSTPPKNAYECDCYECRADRDNGF